MTHQGLYNNRDSNEIVSANRKGVQDDPWDLAVDLKKSTLKPHSAPCPIGLGNKALTDYRCRGTGLVFNKMKLMMDKFLAPILFMLTMLVTANVNAQTGEKQTLDSKQQAIVRIAAVTARGDLGKLQDELNAGLDADLTVNQIKETLIHLYAYAGFPRSLRGLQTFMTVLDERKAQGITDEMGAAASPIDKEGSKYDRGKAVLEELTGVPEKGAKTGYAAFAPEIEVFLKEHLFADIFERDVLTYAERELVTVSVLSSIGGVEPMLRSHLSICLNVGLSPNQLKQFIELIQTSIGENEARAAQIVLDEVLKSKQ